jgi:hypothetical protein
MLVAITALFVSLGGVGYAASTLPASSVGTAQLQHSSVVHSKLRFNSVSYQDIQPQAIGLHRADLNQLQQRVASTCAAGTAIGAIQNNGKVNCNAARPNEFGKITPTAVPVPGTVTTLSLPAGSSYVAFANPVVHNGSGADETCSLTLGSNTDSQHVTVPSGGAASIPLQVAGPAGTATLSCTGAGGTSVTSSINAIETNSNS